MTCCRGGPSSSSATPAASPRFSALHKLTLELTVILRGHGETVAITAPSTTNVLDLARLRALAGE